jgi:hypothetical protein
MQKLDQAEIQQKLSLAHTQSDTSCTEQPGKFRTVKQSPHSNCPVVIIKNGTKNKTEDLNPIY